MTITIYRVRDIRSQLSGIPAPILRNFAWQLKNPEVIHGSMVGMKNSMGIGINLLAKRKIIAALEELANR